jgi:hypothetical protein
MKIRPVGAELLHAGGRTNITKLVVAFRNFANAPETGQWSQPVWIYRSSNSSEDVRRRQGLNCTRHKGVGEWGRAPFILNLPLPGPLLGGWGGIFSLWPVPAPDGPDSAVCLTYSNAT